METKGLQFVEIVNRLKRGTLDGKLLWERTGEAGQQFAVTLENNHRAVVAEAPNGMAVIFTMTNGQGVQTLYLDSSRVADDILRLALLQLFVSVRDHLNARIAKDALDAVRDL